MTGDRKGQKLGNYHLTQLLGQGGFADVYLGEHIYLQTTAAIKVLRTQLTDDGLEKFLAEARTIARLSHPHIIPVLEFGLEDTTPYLVMAYAPYGSLRQRHSRNSLLSLATISPYIAQMAQALQYAHDHGVIHRDVKPANMLIAGNQNILLSDFGIATSASTTTVDRDHQTQTLGTTIYMSPEQFIGRPSRASDQYSLAIIIYEWLSGSPPFDGTMMEVAMQHLHAAPASLQGRVPEVSPAFEALLFRALAKDPLERFPRVQDFADALLTPHGATPATYSNSNSKQLFLPATPAFPTERKTTTGLLSGDYSSGLTPNTFSDQTVAYRPTPLLPMTPRPMPYTTQPPRTTQPPLFRSTMSQPVPPPPLLSARRPLSRRKVLLALGAVGLTTLALAIGATELVSNTLNQSQTPAATPFARTGTTPTAQPTAAPTSTPTADATAVAQAQIVQTIINATTTRIAAAAFGTGQVYTFIRGADTALWSKFFDTTWHGWSSLGEALTYDPVAASLGAGQFDIFVRAADGSIQHKHFDNTTHAWESLGGVSTSDPAVTSSGPGILDVFARGQDNALWHRAFDGTTWQPWESLGGVIASNPTAVSWAPGRIDVFVRAVDNTLAHTWRDTSWHPWESLGGSFIGDPTVTSPGPDLLDIFVCSNSHTLQHFSFNGSAWVNWTDLGGTLANSPTAVSPINNQIEVFARSSDNSLSSIHYLNGQWQTWVPLS